MRQRRLDCPAFLRLSETGQTKRRLIQTYPVTHSMAVSKTALLCSSVSFRSGFRNVHSVLTVINAGCRLNFHHQFPFRNHHRFETYAGSILPNVIQKLSSSVDPTEIHHGGNPFATL
jgi:hypothetical protein